LPVALSAGRAGPGANILFAGRHGPPDKSLTGRSRPWIKFSAREAEIYINLTKIFTIFAIWKIIQFELLIGKSAGNYIKWKIRKSVNFFNENLNFNFFYDKKAGFFLKLGPRAPRLSKLRARAGTSRSFLKSRAGTGSGRPNVTGSSPQDPASFQLAATSKDSPLIQLYLATPVRIELNLVYAEILIKFTFNCTLNRGKMLEWAPFMLSISSFLSVYFRILYLCTLTTPHL
jgi:hypothetical protein